MLSVYQTLSTRYLGRRWVRALLIVASIALGVATLVATRALNETMAKAGEASLNPMPGVADLVVSNGESTLAGSLAKTIARIPGVREAAPRIFENVRLPDLDNRAALVMGIDFQSAVHKKDRDLDVEFALDDDVRAFLEGVKKLVQENRKQLSQPSMKQIVKLSFRNFLSPERQKFLDDFLNTLGSGDSSDDAVVGFLSRFMPPVWVGETLRNELDAAPRKEWLNVSLRLLKVPEEPRAKYEDAKRTLTGWFDYLPAKLRFHAEQALAHLILVKKNPQEEGTYLLRVGVIKARGNAAVLGGHTLSMDLADAGKVLGLEPGKVNRIDVTLEPRANKKKAREKIELAAKGHGIVRTPEEQGEALGNVMSGMQKGFALSGLAALVVGLFLVYNALAVCVAERRHEIGILLSLGATRRQIYLLFAGEAGLLGLIGSLLGIPLGIGMAHLGLQPMQTLVREIFLEIEANQVEVGFGLVVLALAAGIITAIAAALVPAIAASRENPAAAVRQIAKAPTWHNFALQITGTLILVALGLLCMYLRSAVDFRFGAYAGMILVLVGALVAAPLVTAVLARMLQPVAQRLFPITWRLAADNLVRAPGRTGLVIAALAAGVSLVTQTYGTTVSNRTALHEWVQDYIAADLIVTAGSPVGAGGQSATTTEELGRQIEQIPGVEAALPNRDLLIPYGGTQIKLYAFDAPRAYRMEKKRLAKTDHVELYKVLMDTPNAVIISENFAAVHGVHTGDFITLNNEGKEIKLQVIGQITDYSWNHGTIFIDRREFKQFWDSKVKSFDVYVQPNANVAQVRTDLAQRLGAQHGLVVTTRRELQHLIEDVIERIYGIALSLQIVVMLVAALGVVSALLISVLQRKREMGLLRAIGASGSQVIRSFLAEAFLMGVIGTIIGFLVGIPMEWYVLKVLILQESGYLFAVHVPWRESLVIIAAGLSIPVLAGAIPAWFSVRQRIPEAIAYE